MAVPTVSSKPPAFISQPEQPRRFCKAVAVGRNIHFAVSSPPAPLAPASAAPPRPAAAAVDRGMLQKNHHGRLEHARLAGNNCPRARGYGRCGWLLLLLLASSLRCCWCPRARRASCDAGAATRAPGRPPVILKAPPAVASCESKRVACLRRCLVCGFQIQLEADQPPAAGS